MRRLRTSAACLVLLAGMVWFVTALPVLNVARGEEVGPLDESPSVLDGVLVMRNGAVIAGTIVQTGEYYEVRGQYGNAQYPASLVRMRCASLEDAYARLHDQTVAHQSANSHVRLAKWCLTNRLEEEALNELSDALALEPDRDDIQRMIRNLTENAKQVRNQPAAERDEPDRDGKPGATEADESAGLGGLALPQALQFTRRIQPLLVNSCATSGCHARDAKSGFRLQHVLPGRQSNRHASEVNLATILAQIDFKQPAGSRLLTVPRKGHGRQGRPVFVGHRGEDQWRELESWVQAVARDSAQKASLAARGKVVGGTTSTTDAGAVAARARSRDPFTGQTPAAATTLPGERRERTISGSDRGDPFDPTAFNRQSSERR
ncbi:MAG: hypothetical protein HY290_23305 [Planctomycetia bacterium]|nr:hypothetical protein [Planctomycetia bacterium]